MKKILLIIHNQQISRRFSTFLSEMGYRVKTVDDPKMAIAMGKTFSPDLILCEANFPVLSGVTLASLFKNIHEFTQTPFILLANKLNSDETLNRFVESSVADDMVPCPMDQVSLYGTITKWLESDERPAGFEKFIAAPSDTGRFRSSGERFEISKNIKENGKELMKATPSIPPIDHQVKRRESWNKGKVSCTSISKLLYNLIQKKESGILMVRGKQWMKIFVESGKLTDVTSNYIPEDSLGRFLIKQKKITPLENRVSLKRAKQQNLLQGQVLIRLRILDKKELNFYITHHKSTKFLRLFQNSWEKASFKFVPMAKASTSGAMKQVPLGKVLSMGIMKAAKPMDLYDYFVKTKNENTPIKISEDFHEVVENLAMDPRAIDTIKSFDSKSIQEIRNETEEDFPEKLRLAFLMLNTEGADFNEGLSRKKALGHVGLRKAFGNRDLNNVNKENNREEIYFSDTGRQKYNYT